MPIKKQVYGSMDEEPKLSTVNSGKKLVKTLLILLVITLIGLVAALFSYYNTAKKLNNLSTTSGQKEIAKKELDELVKKIGKLIVLPTGEIPTVATITDADGLSKSQSFYLGASNGDKVLIYFKAQKAYIYNPSKDILVNVGTKYYQHCF